MQYLDYKKFRYKDIFLLNTAISIEFCEFPNVIKLICPEIDQFYSNC